MLTERMNRRLLALARLAVNNEDSLAWWTMFELTAGIGTVARDTIYSRALESGIQFAAQLLSDYGDGFTDLPMMLRSRLTGLVAEVLSIVGGLEHVGADLGDGGWGGWLVQQAQTFGGCEDRFADLLLELDEELDPSEGLGHFLGQIQPVGKDIRSGRAAGAVRLMSMASSKG